MYFRIGSQNDRFKIQIIYLVWLGCFGPVTLSIISRYYAAKKRTSIIKTKED